MYYLTTRQWLKTAAHYEYKRCKHVGPREVFYFPATIHIWKAFQNASPADASNRGYMLPEGQIQQNFSQETRNHQWTIHVIANKNVDWIMIRSCTISTIEWTSVKPVKSYKITFIKTNSFSLQKHLMGNTTCAGIATFLINLVLSIKYLKLIF